MPLHLNSTFTSMAAAYHLSSPAHTMASPYSNITSLSSGPQMSGAITTRISTSMPVVNVMGIADPYLDFDYRDFSITLDSAAEALKSSCIHVFDSSYARFIASEFSIGTITTGGYSTYCAQLGPKTTRCHTYQTTYGTLPYVFPFQATPPCCNRCSITAGDIKVYYWPPPTAGPSYSTLVNSNGFKFTYPSVYVAIQTLSAYDLCGPVGTNMNSITTIGFDVTDLSTAASYRFPSDWDYIGDGSIYETWCTYSLINTQKRFECTNITTTAYVLEYAGIVSPTSTIYIDGGSNSTMKFTPVLATYDPCTPYLSVPTRLLSLDPRWSTCTRYLAGLHDPPINLNPENGFFPVTTTSAPASPDPTNTKGLAAPQAFQQFSASKTPPPGAQSTSASGNDPSLPSMIISKLPAVIKFKGTTFTANAESGVIIDSQTLTPGGEITVSQTLLSMADDGLALLIDKTSTQLLDPTYLAGTQTLSVGGPAVVVSGTLVNIQPGGESVIIGGSTTDDMSVLLEGPTSSVRGFGGSQNTKPSSFPGSPLSSGSKRIGCKIRWQGILCIIIIAYSACAFR